MFDTDISMASYQGVNLHRRDGTAYWKLRLTCTKEDCPNEVDMGECLCFHCEEDMVKARDTHGLYCSAKCWFDDHDKETVAKEVARARRDLKELDPEEISLYVDDMKDDILVLDGYWEYLAEMGSYDGSEFFEDYDVQDCPI